MLWPPIDSPAALARLKAEGSELLPGVAGIARRHGLDAVPLERFAGGSLPVFALRGDVVLKLYPPIFSADFTTESRVLARLCGRPACPELLACGALEDWSYVLMSRLEGRSLDEVWGALAAVERRRLGAELGEWTAGLHRTPGEGLALPGPPWADFVAGQRREVLVRQRALGLSERWAGQIEGFLERVELGPREGPVLLHTELAREHVFVVQRAGGWELSGVIDYEPAMLGDRDYEFASVGVFLALGDAGFLGELLRSYGYPADRLRDELPRRFLAWTLLHRFSRLARYLERLPPGEGVDTLEGLAARWWAME